VPLPCSSAGSIFLPAAVRCSRPRLRERRASYDAVSVCRRNAPLLPEHAWLTCARTSRPCLPTSPGAPADLGATVSRCCSCRGVAPLEPRHRHVDAIAKASYEGYLFIRIGARRENRSGDFRGPSRVWARRPRVRAWLQRCSAGHRTGRWLRPLRHPLSGRLPVSVRVRSFGFWPARARAAGLQEAQWSTAGQISPCDLLRNRSPGDRAPAAQGED